MIFDEDLNFRRQDPKYSTNVIIGNSLAYFLLAAVPEQKWITTLIGGGVGNE